MRVPAETYAIVRAMTERGNRPGLIREWLEGVERWAQTHPGQDAAALRNWLSIVKPKPFYTAEELSVMWPGLKIAVGLAQKLEPSPSAFRLANELECCGLPYLGGGKWYAAQFTRPARYFICERIGFWRQELPNQRKFELAMGFSA